MKRLLRTLSIWFQSRRQYDDLADEMKLHLELRARKLRDGGLAPDEADRAAKKNFGSTLQLQEDCRAAWGVRWLDDLRQDLAYSLRTSKRSWVFTAAAVLTLTLGIAANTTVFAFIDALILRPLPVQNPDRLVMLTVHEWVENRDMPAFCYPVFEQIASRAKSVQGLFAWNETQFTLGWGTNAHVIAGGVASGAYYQTLEIHPAAGRLFGPSDDTATAEPVAVLSYGTWQHEFGGSPSAIGRQIRLDGHPFTIMGVEPRNFHGVTTGDSINLTVPFHANAQLHPKWDMLHSTGGWWLTVMGCLRPGVTQQAANAEIGALTKPALESLHINLDQLDVSGEHASKPRHTFGVISGSRGNREGAARYDKPLYVLICISLAVLGIGCLNVANLLLARAIARERELAVRLALGASRLRIVRQLVTESVLLSIVGAILGAFAAFWISRSAAHLITSADVTPDWRVLSFVSAMAVFVTVLFGVAPALRGVALGGAALKFGRVGRALRSARLSQLIVCAQVALSLLLISSAFLFSKSLRALRSQDVGFDLKNLVFCGLDAERSGMNGTQTAAFFSVLLQKVRATPGVASAALSGVVPLSGNYAWDDLDPKQYPNLTREQRQLYTHRVSPGYFGTVKLPLLAGREFQEADANSKLRLGILTRKAAEVYFPDRSALGETLSGDGDPIHIIGIAGDARYQSIRDVAPQTVYFDAFKAGSLGDTYAWSLLVRTTASTSSIASVIRRVAKDSGRDVSVDSPLSFDQQTETTLVTDRLLAMLASGFAAVGCLLAAIGLYGVIAYSVARRTAEIGVRMALGALRTDVVWTVFKEALGVAVFGIGAGVALVLAGGKLIGGLLYQTQAADPFTLLATIAVLLCVVTTAGIVPAIRASRIDPMVALRWE